jgi:AcrR family transcriptional regulator
MARISKDPEERKQEIVQAAYELFKEKGYDNVNVSDIVEKVGVAQGTFYYYFKTKLDVLDAVIDFHMLYYVKALEEIANDPGLTPIEKVQATIVSSARTDEAERNILEILNSNESFVSHKKFMAEMHMIAPPMAKIVEEGVRVGEFKVRNPRETVELMLYMWGCIGDALKLSRDNDEYNRKVQALEDITSKVLGIKEGSIKLAP